MFENKYEGKIKRLKELEEEQKEIINMYIHLEKAVRKEYIRRRNITEEEIIEKIKKEIEGVKPLDFGIS